MTCHVFLPMVSGVVHFHPCEHVGRALAGDPGPYSIISDHIMSLSEASSKFQSRCVPLYSDFVIFLSRRLSLFFRYSKFCRYVPY